MKNLAYTMTVLLAMTFALLAQAKEHSVVGKVLVASGQVEAKHSGHGARNLKRGSKVYVSDKITLAKDARAQIRFADGAMVSLQPESTLEIKAYLYSQTNKTDNQSWLNLIKGGLRAITGAVADESPENYKTTTPIATIGVRGTDYRVLNSGYKVGVASGEISVTPTNLNSPHTYDMAAAHRKYACETKHKEQLGHCVFFFGINEAVAFDTLLFDFDGLAAEQIAGFSIDQANAADFNLTAVDTAGLDQFFFGDNDSGVLGSVQNTASLSSTSDTYPF